MRGKQKSIKGALKFKMTSGEEVVFEIVKPQKLSDGSPTVLMLSVEQQGVLKLSYCPRLIGEFAEFTSIEVIREED